VQYVKFLKTLATTLNKEFAVSKTPKGFSRTGIVSTFDALRSLSGIKMYQANAPITDADKLVASKGLRTSFKNARHQKIADILFDLMFGTLVETDARMSAVSSSTIPYFTSEILDKQLFVRRALANLPDILKRLTADDFTGLLKDYGFAICNILGERHQPDGWIYEDGVLKPKPRQVVDPQDALAGNPVQHESSKTKLIQDIWGHEGVAAMRVRTVYAASGVSTYLITCLMSMARAHYLNEYDFTWHHRTSEHTLASLQSRQVTWAAGVDVTQMDQHVPSFFMDFYARKWAQRVDPNLAQIFHLLNYSPYFAPQLGPGLSPFWAGNPFEREGFNTYVGLSSGRPDNPDIGKYWMTFVYLLVMDELTHDLLELDPNPHESLAKVLHGDHPDLILKALGDDAIICGRSGGRISQDTLTSYLASPKSSEYALLDVESALAFLGSIGIADNEDRLVDMQPNPVTEVVNWFNAEHGVDSRHRQYWSHGLFARLEHYSRSSMAADVWRRSMEVWRQVLPDVPTPEAAAFQHRKANPAPLLASLSEIDAQVLLDRSKLYYKFSPEDVSSEVLDLFTARIPGDLIHRAFSPFI
jgi:hypothetical protein